MESGQSGFQPGLPEVSSSLLSFPFCLAHCSFDASSRRSCLCQTLAHWPLGASFYSEVQVARAWVGLHVGQFWLGMNTCGACCISPKGTLDTSLICLPHTIVQTPAQTPGQLPGLGQRLYVKESPAQVCPCPVEVSCPLSIRKQRHANRPSILFFYTAHFVPLVFLRHSLRYSECLKYPPQWHYLSPKSAIIFSLK